MAQVSLVRSTRRAPPSKLTYLWVIGSTFRATHIHTGQVVALKVQPSDVSYPSNTHERMVYPLLQGGVGMPTLWASGLWGRWDYLAMDLLGNSLERLYRKSGKNVMDLRSACSFAIQLVCSFLLPRTASFESATCRFLAWSLCTHVACCIEISNLEIASSVASQNTKRYT